MYSENYKVNNVMLWANNTEKVRNEIINACRVYKRYGVSEDLARKISWVRYVAEHELSADCRRRGEKYELLNVDDCKEFRDTLLSYVLNNYKELG